jgi:ATP-dependent RNA helicase HrpA
LPLATAQAVDVVGLVLEAAHQVEARLHGTGLQGAASPALAPAAADARADARAQFDALIYPGFVSETGLARLPDLVRYLRAIGRRLDTMAQNPGRDAERTAAVARVTDAWHRAVAGLPPGRRGQPDAQSVRWLIEELRVSLFAQVVGTPVPVSEKRILTAIDRLTEP